MRPATFTSALAPACLSRPTWLTDDDPFVRMGGSASRLRPESSLALVPAP